MADHFNTGSAALPLCIVRSTPLSHLPEFSEARQAKVKCSFCSFHFSPPHFLSSRCSKTICQQKTSLEKIMLRNALWKRTRASPKNTETRKINIYNKHREMQPNPPQLQGLSVASIAPPQISRGTAVRQPCLNDITFTDRWAVVAEASAEQPVTFIKHFVTPVQRASRFAPCLFPVSELAQGCVKYTVSVSQKKIP